jgi:UPF0716 protein FxsA
MRRMQDRMEAELLAQGVRVPGQNPFGQSPFGGAGAARGEEGPAPSRGRVIQGHFEPDTEDKN